MADSRLDQLPLIVTLDDDSLVYAAQWNGATYDSSAMTYSSLSSQVMSAVTLADAVNNGNSADGIGIENLGEPVSGSDAATKNYVDTQIPAQATLKNRSPAGNFAQNPWQNGDVISDAFDQNTIARCTDRWFTVRISGSAGATGSIEKVTLPVPDPEVSRNNVAIKVESTAVQAMGANEQAVLFTRINGIDMSGLEGDGVGYMIVSFSASVEAGAEGIYSLAFQHDNDGVDDLNYFTEVNLTTSHTFYSFAIPTPPVSSSDFMQYDTSRSFIVGFLLSGGTNFQGAPDAWVADGPVASTSQENFFSQIGNVLYLSDFSLCKGMIDLPANTVYQIQCSCSDEVVDHCLHYYQKSYANGAVAGDATNVGAFLSPGLGGFFTGEPNIAMNASYSDPMIKVPQVDFYNPTDGTPGEWGRYDDVTSEDALLVWATEESFAVINAPGGSTDSEMYKIHWVADTET